MQPLSRFLRIFAKVQANINMVRILAALAIAAALTAACSGKVDTGVPLLPEDIRLKPGDVVLRRGGGMASHAVLMADAGGAYSHVGMVVDSAGVMMVAHAVPGEPDFEGDPDRVKLEPPEAYYDPGRATRGCIMRCADSAVAARAAARAMAAYRRRALFDHDYDCHDTTRVYCSELVEAAYAAEGLPIAATPRHDINLPGLSLKGVILPSDFRRSRRLRVVAEF